MTETKIWTPDELARALRERSEWSGSEGWEAISPARKELWQRFAVKVALLLGTPLVIPRDVSPEAVVSLAKKGVELHTLPINQPFRLFSRTWRVMRPAPSENGIRVECLDDGGTIELPPGTLVERVG